MERDTRESSTWPVYHRDSRYTNYTQTISNMSEQSSYSIQSNLEEESAESELLDSSEINCFDSSNHSNTRTLSKRHSDRSIRINDDHANIRLKQRRISSNIEQLSVGDTDYIPNTPDWNSHPTAWACLHNSYGVPIYLTSKTKVTDRAGYLVGSDPSCDIGIDHPAIHKRHCIIYYENYTLHRRTCCIRVYLKELSPTKILLNGKPIETDNPTDVFLHNNDIINFSGLHKRDKTTFYFTMKPNPKSSSFCDKYDMGNRIGSGVSSRVHQVTSRDASRKGKIKVAKIISKMMFTGRHKVQTQFRREIGLSMSLEFHPGIAPIKEVYNEQNKYFLLMEYAVDGDLYACINGNPLSESSARIVFAQILSALKFLHERNIIHRDIKAENVLIMDKSKMHVKLCDFGLATICRDSSTLLSCCGTPIYAAPEVEICQYSPDNKYGRECDLWSVGVLLYVCLCNLYPFFEDLEYSRKQRTALGIYDIYNPNYQRLSDEVKDLMAQLFKVNINDRIYLYDTLKHPWLIAEAKYTEEKLKEIHPSYSFPL